jgi:hypothetical protein
MVVSEICGFGRRGKYPEVGLYDDPHSRVRVDALFLSARKETHRVF